MEKPPTPPAAPGETTISRELAIEAMTALQAAAKGQVHPPIFYAQTAALMEHQLGLCEPMDLEATQSIAAADETVPSIAETMAKLVAAVQWFRSGCCMTQQTPARRMYHAFEQGMYAGWQGANHKLDCPYSQNDYRMWWAHGCIVGEQRRQAALRIAELEDEAVERAAEPQRVAGVDLPDGDCHWRRREGDWRIITGELSHSCRDAFAGWRGSEIVRGLLHELPKGGWTRAVPASEEAELRDQLSQYRDRDSQMKQRLDGVYGALADAETVVVHIDDPGASVRELSKERDAQCIYKMRAIKELAAAKARIAELEAERDAMLD